MSPTATVTENEKMWIYKHYKTGETLEPAGRVPQKTSYRDSKFYSDELITVDRV